MFPGDLRTLREAIGDYWTGGSGTNELPMYALRLLCAKRGGKRSTLEHLCGEIESLPLTQPPAIKRIVQDYITKRGLERIVESISGGIDKNQVLDPLAYQRQLRELTIAFEDRKAEVYNEAPTQYQDLLNIGRVPTGFPLLDVVLGGGLGVGELGVAIAPFSGGKTTFLINLGASAVLAGKKVLHLTLEISRYMVLLRYDMRFGGYTLSEVKEEKNVKKARAKASVGHLTIQDSSHQRCTPLGLENILERSVGKYDLILVDYADLLSSDRGIEGRRFELGDVYRELRRIASSSATPLWTASQATREASRTGEFSASDIAEDISKMHTADVAVCLLQTRNQKREGRMNLRVDKTRMGNGGEEIPVHCDFSRMLLAPGGEE